MISGAHSGNDNELIISHDNLCLKAIDYALPLLKASVEANLNKWVHIVYTIK